MKCNQMGCEEDAVMIVYWPGKTPPPVYCKYDAQRAVAIAATMGLAVHVEVIDEGEDSEVSSGT